MKKLLLLLLCILFIFSSCRKTEGCVEGDCENGYGTFIEKNKGTYVGEFKDGKFHGQGIFDYLPGKSLEKESGNWKDNELHGKGTKIWSKDYDTTHQQKYIGNFRDGRIDGYGTNWYQWGDYFVGDFDCCSGRNPTQEGTMYHLDGTSEYGQWETTTTYKRY